MLAGCLPVARRSRPASSRPGAGGNRGQEGCWLLADAVMVFGCGLALRSPRWCCGGGAAVWGWGVGEQPRVGNQDFADFLWEKIPAAIRLVHQNDVVPHLPPRGAGPLSLSLCPSALLSLVVPLPPPCLACCHAGGLARDSSDDIDLDALSNVRCPPLEQTSSSSQSSTTMPGRSSSLSCSCLCSRRFCFSSGSCHNAREMPQLLKASAPLQRRPITSSPITSSMSSPSGLSAPSPARHTRPMRRHEATRRASVCDGRGQGADASRAMGGTGAGMANGDLGQHLRDM